jgi:hypothetical protein
VHDVLKSKYFRDRKAKEIIFWEKIFRYNYQKFSGIFFKWLFFNSASILTMPGSFPNEKFYCRGHLTIPPNSKDSQYGVVPVDNGAI